MKPLKCVRVPLLKVKEKVRYPSRTIGEWGITLKILGVIPIFFYKSTRIFVVMSFGLDGVFIRDMLSPELNNNFKDYTREILPVGRDQLSKWLAYFHIQYRLQKFTDAKFKFVEGRLTFTNGLDVSEIEDEKSEKLFDKISTYLYSCDKYSGACSLAVTAAVGGGAIYLASRKLRAML